MEDDRRRLFPGNKNAISGFIVPGTRSISARNKGGSPGGCAAAPPLQELRALCPRHGAALALFIMGTDDQVFRRGPERTGRLFVVLSIYLVRCAGIESDGGIGRLLETGMVEGRKVLT